MNRSKLEDQPQAVTNLWQVRNIAEQLPEDELLKIGRRVCDEYNVDLEDSNDWIEDAKKYTELASHLMGEKNTPWEGAANIKLPLLSDAAVKFQARAYAEIVRPDGVVSTQVTGEKEQQEKADRAERVKLYMDWQLTKSMIEWEADTDRLLMMLPICGHVYRKQYYDHRKGRVSSCLKKPGEVIVNKGASNIHEARRASDKVEWYETDYNSLVNAGIYKKVDLTDDTDSETEDIEYEFIEQHRWLDLDEDGIDEPYLVICHLASHKVVHISARYTEDDIVKNPDTGKVISINPIHYLHDYMLLPSFDGSYLGMGLGKLMFGLNEAANTIANQLLDAGTRQNAGGGLLSKSIKIQGGKLVYRPGEYVKTQTSSEDLQKGVFPFPNAAPSPTLFQLLGLIIEMAKESASVKDVLVGESPGANVPASTTAMLVEQGLKTYSAIYKRIYRSLSGELRSLYRLNYEYMNVKEYFKVADTDKIAFKEDFDYRDCDITPVSDPNASSDIQKIAIAEAQVKAIELPGVNPRPLVKAYLEALKVKEIDEALPEQQGPSPQEMAMQMEMEIKQREMAQKDRELELKQAEVLIKAKEAEDKGDKYLADALRSIADAEAKEKGQQMAAYEAVLNSIGGNDVGKTNPGRSGSMGKSPDNANI